MSRAVRAAAVSVLLAIPSAAGAQGPVELKLKWAPGTRVVQRLETDQKGTMTVPGMPQPVQQDMKQVQEFALSVLKARPGGGYEIEMEFLAMKMDMSAGFMKQNVDCATKPKDPIGSTMCAMIGEKVSFTLAADNSIERIQGFDAVLAKVTAASPQASAAVKEMFNEDTMKQMATKMFTQGLPAGPVKVGDTWPFNIEMPLPKMAILVLEAKSTFKGWETRDNRRCAALAFTGTMKSKPLPNAVPGMTLSLQDGVTSGTTWFDPELGMAVESDMNQAMTLDMTAQGQKMSMKMNQRVTMKVVEIGTVAKGPAKKR